MGQLVLNFPDAQDQRIIDALSHDFGWSTESGITKAQAAKRQAGQIIKERVVQVEENIARAALQPQLPPDIT